MYVGMRWKYIVNNDLMGAYSVNRKNNMSIQFEYVLLNFVIIKIKFSKKSNDLNYGEKKYFQLKFFFYSCISFLF